MSASVTGAKRSQWHPSWPDVEAIVEGRHADPFAVLGMHPTNKGSLSVAAFLPNAEAVEVVAPPIPATRFEQIHECGFFASTVPGREPYAYRLRISRGAEVWEAEDPYPARAHAY